MSRTKEFLPEVALDRAMDLFWTQGFEATSVQDLLDAMGINRASMYATFGDKRQLFLKAVQRYTELMSATRIKAIREGEDGLKAIGDHFEFMAKLLGSPKGERGCLMTNAVCEIGSRDPELSAITYRMLDRLEEAYNEALEKARAAGQIRKSGNLRDVARFLRDLQTGMMVIAHTKPDPDHVRRTAAVALDGLRPN